MVVTFEDYVASGSEACRFHGEEGKQISSDYQVEVPLVAYNLAKLSWLESGRREPIDRDDDRLAQGLAKNIAMLSGGHVSAPLPNRLTTSIGDFNRANMAQMKRVARSFDGWATNKHAGLGCIHCS